MQATVDAVGRIVVPKPMRDALGLEPGSRVDLTLYGAGIQIVPGDRTARLVETAKGLIADSDTKINDDTVLALVDALRR